MGMKFRECKGKKQCTSKAWIGVRDIMYMVTSLCNKPHIKRNMLAKTWLRKQLVALSLVLWRIERTPQRMFSLRCNFTAHHQLMRYIRCTVNARYSGVVLPCRESLVPGESCNLDTSRTSEYRV